ncbi:hypothetical protein HYH03_007727 [Edaphochlamys debaryana]|uniref:Uncharacterized protein n=1 Tax=Edaphochlamys debaryana TaxID=47281 RepID=A0A835XZW0_9CHLO|nr:hypothetical protein HYH03_007727 [Edaphochlamys debaryana]|eukprot:KAG2494087.1 hypothetical protein HYH03_007727 [Edaphochlamys debaryana]
MLLRRLTACRWICCASAACSPVGCSANATAEGNACLEATTSTYTVAYMGGTTLPLQIHDGSLAGNNSCSGGFGYGADQCCSGGGVSNCGTAASVCSTTAPIQGLDIPPPPSPPPPSPPPPQPAPAEPSPSQPAAQPPSSQPPTSQPPAAQPASSEPPTSPQPRAPQPAASQPAPQPAAPEPSSSYPPPSPAPLVCNGDTAWLAPASTGPAQPGQTIPAYTTPPLTATSPPVAFNWYPIQTLLPSNQRWGGYFTLPSPPIGTTYTSFVPIPASGSQLYACAGCSSNDPANGYYLGGAALAVTTISATQAVATCTIRIASPGGSGTPVVSVTNSHFYASYLPLDTASPGSFPPSTTSPALPQGEGSTITIRGDVQGGPRPTTNPVVYLACHLDATTCS